MGSIRGRTAGTGLAAVSAALLSLVAGTALGAKGDTIIASRSSSGLAGNADSDVTFSSDADNLTVLGNDSFEDIFRFDLLGP